VPLADGTLSVVPRPAQEKQVAQSSASEERSP
jgi:hypothetical protein